MVREPVMCVTSRHPVAAITRKTILLILPLLLRQRLPAMRVLYSLLGLGRQGVFRVDLLSDASSVPSADGGASEGIHRQQSQGLNLCKKVTLMRGFKTRRNAHSTKHNSSDNLPPTQASCPRAQPAASDKQAKPSWSPTAEIPKQHNESASGP